MHRRRFCWLCAGLLMVSSVLVAWYVLAERDSDFHVVGPKTRGVRANFALLDSKIDIAHFQDCKTIQAGLNRLHHKICDDEETLEPGKPAEMHRWMLLVLNRAVTVDSDAFGQEGTRHITERPVQYPAQPQMMSVKEFLRMTFRQAGAGDAHFIVRGHSIEATTLTRAQEARDHYVASVSLYDRMRNMWKDMTGHVEEDPPKINLNYIY